MASFACLLHSKVNDLLETFRSGKVTAQDLIDMGTEGRNKFFQQFTDAENAKKINIEFESKLVLKDQKAGLTKLIGKLEGVNAQVRADMVDRVQKLDKVLSTEEHKQLLADLAEKKLGVRVTLEEARTISKLSQIAAKDRKTLQEELSKASIDSTKTSFTHTPETQDAAIRAVTSKFVLDRYINDLKNKNSDLTFGQRFNPKNVFRNIGDLIQTTKSLVYALNPHGMFKHGLPSLTEIPKEWGKNLLKGYADAYNTLIHNKDTEAATAIAIMSRPNAINGLYDIWDRSILKQSEEFKATTLGKLPLGVGRLWRASKAQFDNPLKTLRADSIDHYINIVDKMGLNPRDPEVAKEWGHLAIMQTGGQSAYHGEEGSLSKFLSSERLIKAQVDVLTRPFNPWSKDSLAVRIKAATVLIKMSLGMAVTILIVKEMAKAFGYTPSIGTNPDQSSTFMKLKAGPVTIDLSGGYGGYIALAAKELSGQSISASGNATDLANPKFGGSTRLTTLEQFIQGKLSPTIGTVASYLAGQDFSGNKPTIKSSLSSTFVPIPIQNQVSAASAGMSDKSRIALFLAETVGGLITSVSSPATTTPSITAQANTIRQASETPDQKAIRSAAAKKVAATRAANNKKIVSQGYVTPKK